MFNKFKGKIYIAITLIVIFLFEFSACSNLQSISMEPEHRLQWWLESINWDSNRDDLAGKGIKIAILDSGVDSKHADLVHCIKKTLKVSELQKQENSEIYDDVSHGTAVAGIIAGYPSTPKGILGIAPESEIISIDVTDDADGKIESSAVVEGIYMAIREKVNIISISVGLQNESTSLHNAIKSAYDNNIIIIASAGNYTNTKLLYPAAYDEVLCVGAKNKDGDILFPKNYSGKKILYLPGENIVTTLPNQEYGAIFGTSAAAPILTGTIAIMLQANSTLKSSEIYDYFSKYENNLDVQKCINETR